MPDKKVFVIVLHFKIEPEETVNKVTNRLN